jgi:Nuclear protein Es2
MTWGTLAGTPRILSESDDPAEASAPMPSTPFLISAPTKREVLSHKLSSSASKSLRAKAGLLGPAYARRKGDMPPPSWTPRRAEASGSLMPAAKRLLDRTTMGTAASRRGEAMGRAAGWENNKDKDLNRVRWTPTPNPVTQRFSGFSLAVLSLCTVCSASCSIVCPFRTSPNHSSGRHASYRRARSLHRHFLRALCARAFPRRIVPVAIPACTAGRSR